MKHIANKLYYLLALSDKKYNLHNNTTMTNHDNFNFHEKKERKNLIEFKR